MAASADALLLFVPVAGDAPASSVAEACLRRPRLARPENDGGKNASADTDRTDAPVKGRVNNFRGSVGEPPAADKRAHAWLLAALGNLRMA